MRHAPVKNGGGGIGSLALYYMHVVAHPKNWGRSVAAPLSVTELRRMNMPYQILYCKQKTQSKARIACVQSELLFRVRVADLQPNPLSPLLYRPRCPSAPQSVAERN